MRIQLTRERQPLQIRKKQFQPQAQCRRGMIWAPNDKPVQQKMRDVVECDVWDRVPLILFAERFPNHTLELRVRGDFMEVLCDGDEIGEFHLGIHGVYGGDYPRLGIDALEESGDGDARGKVAMRLDKEATGIYCEVLEFG